MRSLFSQASDYLKLRQTELERRIEFSEGSNDHYDHQQLPSPIAYSAQENSSESVPSPLTSNKSGSNSEDDGGTKGKEKYEATDPSIGGLARMTLEESFNWKEFQQLYYESDLFKWHREAYLENDGMADLDEMKRIWIENEKCYERSFIEGARKRFQQDGSKNAKKTQRRIE